MIGEQDAATVRITGTLPGGEVMGGRHVVVMGVSGCGKSTVAGALAGRLGVPFAEGDEFHSDQARASMAAGVPLTDEDRWPWLGRLADWMSQQAGSGSVVSCSALRHAYRDALRAAEGSVAFVHLELGREELRRRMALRADHYMPVSLLDSQLATLEPLAEGEGVVIDGDRPVARIVEEIRDRLGL